MPGEILTHNQVEEVVNAFAQKYAREMYHLPTHAVRVILQPTTDFICRVDRGVTAIIRMGRMPGDPAFNEALRNAIELIAKRKLYERMEVESVADILRHEEHLRRFKREHRIDRIAPRVGDHELTVRRLYRIEVVHKKTGKREVVESEVGNSNFGTMLEVGRNRIAVALAKEQAEADPFQLPSDDPEWIARTN